MYCQIIKVDDAVVQSSFSMMHVSWQSEKKGKSILYFWNRIHEYIFSRCWFWQNREHGSFLYLTIYIDHLISLLRKLFYDLFFKRFPRANICHEKKCWHVLRFSHMQLEVYPTCQVDPTARDRLLVLVLIAQDSPTHSSWNPLCCHAKRTGWKQIPNSIPTIL